MSRWPHVRSAIFYHRACLSMDFDSWAGIPPPAPSIICDRIGVFSVFPPHRRNYFGLVSDNTRGFRPHHPPAHRPDYRVQLVAFSPILRYPSNEAVRQYMASAIATYLFCAAHYFFQYFGPGVFFDIGLRYPRKLPFPFQKAAFSLIPLVLGQIGPHSVYITLISGRWFGNFPTRRSFLTVYSVGGSMRPDRAEFLPPRHVRAGLPRRFDIGSIFYTI